MEIVYVPTIMNGMDIIVPLALAEKLGMQVQEFVVVHQSLYGMASTV